MNEHQEHVAFYHEIGLTLTQFSLTEYKLAYIAGLCLNDIKNHHKVISSFFAIENFRTKLKYVDCLIKLTYPKSKHLEDWKVLFKTTKTLSEGRNKLAHYTVIRTSDEVPGKVYALCPWVDRSEIDNYSKGMEPQNSKEGEYVPLAKGSMHLRDINALRNKIFANNVALDNLIRRIIGKEEINKAAETPRPSYSLPEILSWFEK